MFLTVVNLPLFILQHNGMPEVKILIASRDGSTARCCLKDLQIQSEVWGNMENLHCMRVRWKRLTYDGKGTRLWIPGSAVGKLIVTARCECLWRTVSNERWNGTKMEHTVQLVCSTEQCVCLEIIVGPQLVETFLTSCRTQRYIVNKGIL